MKLLIGWLGWLFCESAFQLFDRDLDRAGGWLYRRGCSFYSNAEEVADG
jgi:hypothetical protein|tara:strand:+ start:8208 stop:8354 length:147 start_codon:yes stop_codon:yes gene_type:complete